MKEEQITIPVFVSVDTGGTFTDFVCFRNGRFQVFKYPSSREDPSEAVLKGLEQIVPGCSLRVIHGSTVATNTLLERKGAKTAIITNKGFEDILEIGRQTRSRIYDLFYRRQNQLVDSKLRFGINCRIDSGGRRIEELDRRELTDIVKAIRAHGVDSVAVCLLFSFLDPSDEMLIEKAMENSGVEVSLSCDVLKEFREYERLSTTVIDAYVKPVMRRYLKGLSDALGEKMLSIMQSNGGRISVKAASRQPVRTILSGPAGGVVGALRTGVKAGFDKIISFDMGGTSTDVALIDGKLPLRTDSIIAGLPVQVPMIDIQTVGAGGGSIARFDEGGALTVGPQSAGAHPGPICYGKGCSEPTVTDANLLLGRLIPENFLGGAVPILKEPAERVFNNLARLWSMTRKELAEGICTVANSNMERAIRVVSVEKGHDPGDFTLVSFGGAGAMHAAFLAESLGIPRVLIPEHPGVLSAMGMLLSDVIMDYSLTVMQDFSLFSEEDLNSFYASLESRAIGDMRDEGFMNDQLLLERYADLRYKGQSYELIVPWSSDLAQGFHAAHQRAYGYCDREGEIEMVNVRLRAVAETDKPSLECCKIPQTKDPSEAVICERSCVFDGVTVATKLYRRSLLREGFELEGPAIIAEYSSTTVLPPGMILSVDSLRNMVIDCTGRR